MTDAAPTPRRHFRFGLRSLFVLTAVVAVFMSFWVYLSEFAAFFITTNYGGIVAGWFIGRNREERIRAMILGWLGGAWLCALLGYWWWAR